MAWFFSKISNMMDFFFVEKVSLVKKGQIITVHFLQVDKPSENRVYDVMTSSFLKNEADFDFCKLETPQPLLS